MTSYKCTTFIDVFFLFSVQFFAVCPLRQRWWGWMRLELCLKFLFIQNEESKPKEDNIDFSWKLIWNQTRLIIASCLIVINYIQAHLFDWKPIIYYVYFYLKMIGKIEIRKNEMAEIKVKTLGKFRYMRSCCPF
jgi:hypothetical protein